MSAQVAPLLRVRGRVRNIVERPVDPIEAVAPEPAQYNDQGELIRPARPGREAKDGYLTWDVLIDTHLDGQAVPSGMVEVVMIDRYMEATGGYLPSIGDEVDWPVRGYQKWVGPQGRRRSVNGYSFAGDVYAGEQKKTGARVASVPAAANG